MVFFLFDKSINDRWLRVGIKILVIIYLFFEQKKKKQKYWL